MRYHVGQHEIEKEKLKSLFPTKDVVGLFEHVGAFCAGGAITSLFTNKEVNDLDIYFPSREALVKAVESLFGGDYGHELICTNYTDKSILFTKEDCDVQFIYFDYFSTPIQGMSFGGVVREYKPPRDGSHTTWPSRITPAARPPKSTPKYRATA